MIQKRRATTRASTGGEPRPRRWKRGANLGIIAGAPTGQVFNSASSSFVLHAGGASASALFLFASENGTITGWAPTVPPSSGISTRTVTAVRTPGAVYKGLAIETSQLVPLLCAAKFATGAIDVFDSHFRPVPHPGRFIDPALPRGYAPFNIANLNGKLYVTYAKQDPRIPSSSAPASRPSPTGLSAL
jgi:uncharacterized protein (TIGR03118 family)